MADNATVKLTAENAQLKATLDQSSQAIDKFAGNMKTVFAAAAAFIVAKFSVNLFAGFISDAQEANRNSMVLANTVKNLGDEAAMSADEVEDFADAFERVEGIDGESTKKFVTDLLRMNTLDADGIKQVTRAAADLGVAMGTSFEDGAETLKMVFANPEMGIKKLRQAGILFTETEQAMVKAMAEAGDQAGVQDLILVKLHESIGGLSQEVAKSAEGTWAKFKQRLGDVGEQIGQALIPILNAMLPVLDNVAQWLQENVGPAIEYVQAGFAALGEFISTYVVPVLQWLLDAGIVAFTGLEVAIDNFATAAELAITAFAYACVVAFEEVVYFITKVIPEYLSWFGRNWKNIFVDIGNLTTTIFKNLWSNVKAIWKSITDVFSGEGLHAPKFVGLLDGFQSSLEELPKIAAREMGSVERELGKNVDKLQDKLGKAFDEKLAANRKAMSGFFEGGPTAKQQKTEQEWQVEQDRLRDQLEAKGMSFEDAYKKAEDQINNEKAKENKSSMGNVEDLVALNTRIAKAAGSAPEEKIVDAVAAGAEKVAAEAKKTTASVQEVEAAMRLFAPGGRQGLVGRNSATAVQGT